MMEDETDKYIKGIWQEHFKMEAAHLKRVAELLQQYEQKAVKDVIPAPEFPTLLKFGQNKEYIRQVIKDTVYWTSDRENYVDVGKLPEKADFFCHNKKVNGAPVDVASHQVIMKSIKEWGKDYRFQDKPHPIKELDDRKTDNTTVGREPSVGQRTAAKPAQAKRHHTTA
jgi:hypothetical protein